MKIVEPMPLERAEKIVAACVSHGLHHLGIAGDAPRSLKEYSLGELLEAQRVVKAHDEHRPDMKMHVVCDDRLIAALYVASHYDGEACDSCAPIAVADGKGVLVISLASVEARG